MAIQKPYADYDWYKVNYFGAVIPEEAFPSFAMKASYLVDGLTAGNLQSLDVTPDCVKDAVCAAAEKPIILSKVRLKKLSPKIMMDIL